MNDLKSVTIQKYLVEFFKKDDKGHEKEIGFINILYPSNATLAIESFAFLRAPPEWCEANVVRVHRR